MDRKMVCGILLVIIGLVFTSVSTIYVALSENITYSDNGRQIFGIFGSLLATHMLVPLIISLVILIQDYLYVFCWHLVKNSDVKNSSFHFNIAM